MRITRRFSERVFESYTRSVRRTNLKVEDFHRFFATLMDMARIPRFQATYQGHLLTEWKMTPGIAAILPPCEIRADISNSLAKSVKTKPDSEEDVWLGVTEDWNNEGKIVILDGEPTFDLIEWNSFIAQLNASINTPSTPLNLTVSLDTAIAAANIRDIEDRLCFNGHMNWDGTKTIWPVRITLCPEYDDAYYNARVTDVCEHFIAFDVPSLLK